MVQEIQLQEIKYYRQIKPPSLKQFLFRKAVKEKMSLIKGQTGVIIENGRPIPVSALAAREALKGLTATQLLVEHPEWVADYKETYGGPLDYKNGIA
jgi:hypothetical protein